MSIPLTVKKGDIIFREGNFSDCAFIIEKGLFEVSKTDEEGKKKVIGALHTGDIFGEMGLIDGKPRSATVIALEDGRISILSRESFEALAERKPESLMPLLRVLSIRLRDTLQLVSLHGTNSNSTMSSF
ncbi:MAG: hypothetical protein COV67_01510 [Nitrospinae bacterium CG11_big_fil_rev_8_21_14_0_20_56_8]|nr:MAG: hypothetical protein COV67_01510 [Nitrospinae bacterium CG11_big_fil_rev_8_21_14_0_20_56_8]